MRKNKRMKMRERDWKRIEEREREIKTKRGLSKINGDRAVGFRRSKR